jgi:DNA polymerase-3 subunit gamma/tau
LMAGTGSTKPSLSADTRYRVLARKYRPSRFAALIGQEALVRTLSNAFSAGRIAHAYMLAGVRGVGKTTTARIIARALNCVGADGRGGVTIEPCGVCEQCVSIGEDRHLDVIEMDAASHTGVDNIRELLDGVPYKPAIARFKVYIIDEVHMLSEKAFNALLKTLEEPPEHVKFIFATTEVRKVPVTVLSRCQRFDLRRIEPETLEAHLSRIVEQESVRATPAALKLLARGADGSVRDALSLLDQAIAHGDGEVQEVTVREMLGLADRTVCFDLLERTLRGEVGVALAVLAEQHAAGADPIAVVEDLLSLVHWLTRLKISPTPAGAAPADADWQRAAELAQALSMATLTRAWQMLLKGLGEMRIAPSSLHAAEMLLIRMAYASRLPAPAEALEAFAAARSSSSADGSTKTGGSGVEARGGDASVPALTGEPAFSGASGSRQGGSGTPPAALSIPAASAPLEEAGFSHPETNRDAAEVRCFADVVRLAQERNEWLLYGQLMTSVHLVQFEVGRIELRLAEDAPADLPHRLNRLLGEGTASRWIITLSHEMGEPTLQEQQQAAKLAQLDEVRAHPLVRSIMEAFPGAVVERLREGDALPPADPEADSEA